MNFKFIILLTLVVVSSYGKSSNSRKTEISSLIPKIEDLSAKWIDLCKRLTEMMMNCEDVRKETTDVAIYMIGNEHVDKIYDGFQKTLMAQGGNKIATSIHNDSSEVIENIRKDFLVLLIQENLRYDAFIEQEFTQLFVDTSIKIFVILSSKFSFDNLILTWDALDLSGYFNIYAVHHKESGWFEIYRTGILKQDTNQIQHYLQKREDNNFLMVKDVIKGDEYGNLRLVFYNSYPLSYVKGKVILGADGNLIDEFSKKVNTPYLVMNDYTAKPSALKIYKLLNTGCDLSIYTYTTVQSANIQTVWLYQMHGTCILVPRNIPVSAYENFSFPLDRASMIMAVISTISVIICWRLITNEMSISSILFAVYELILNLGASGIERITLREIFLVYSFIFSSFILVSFYESMFLSIMLAEPTWRSASSLEELNETNTIFFSFYDDQTARLNDLPIIRTDLVMNYVDFHQNIYLDVPDEFDNNLVYLVFCDYADYFIHSSRNHNNGRRLYDKIIITTYYKTYSVNKGYFHVDKFVEMVKRMMESGIYGFWNKQDIEAPEGSKLQNGSEDEHIDMSTPIYLLVIGCSIALLVCLIEIASFKCLKYCSNRFHHLNSQVRDFVPKKKLQLDRWRRKFIFKERLNTKKLPLSQKNLPSKCQGNEEIVCRESVCGGYFMIKKMKKLRKPKASLKPKGYRFIQVQPCNPESSTD